MTALVGPKVVVELDLDLIQWTQLLNWNVNNFRLVGHPVRLNGTDMHLVQLKNFGNLFDESRFHIPRCLLRA